MPKLFFGLTEEQYEESFDKEFSAFFNQLIIDEGGYVTGDQAKKFKDPGGATKYGISLTFLKGLGIDVTNDIVNDGVVDERDIVALTQDQARELYFKYFFNPLYLKIDNVQIANKVFNIGVNIGKVKAVEILQDSVNKTFGAPLVVVDGSFGMKTLAAVNQVNQQKLYDNYVIAIEVYYTSLNKGQFLAGWIKRAKELLLWT